MAGLGCLAKTAEQVVEQSGAADEVKGRVAIITGPTSGIGQYTALVFARLGMHVILAGRNKNKLQETIKLITQQVPDAHLTALQLDLVSLSSVRRFAEEFLALNLPLHYLINNAGIMAVPFQLTDDGFELQVGSNHLGHFLLTELLLSKLKASAPARIVNVSSLGERMSPALEPKNLASLKPTDFTLFGPWRFYGLSKLCNILHARELARRLKGSGVSAFSLHPGTILTGLTGHLGWANSLFNVVGRLFTRSMTQGASTTIYCALQPGLEAQSGEFFDMCRLGSCSAQAKDERLAAELYEASLQLVTNKKRA